MNLWNISKLSTSSRKPIKIKEQQHQQREEEASMKRCKVCICNGKCNHQALQSSVIHAHNTTTFI